MTRKTWFFIFVVLVALVILTGCSIPDDEDQPNLPTGAVRIGEVDVGADGDVTIWNWCDRGTKVYLSVMRYKGVSLATSPDHKDCQ